ncbi:tyrosine-type recombinase/integrase [Mesorhizobium sp. ESP6-5]|uniref:tyrosine-type recombinase/integrase n=1 Tax=Mesorhizobium sp. ESP6-5 TaxID=2876623 RepID=UPI0029621C96|nr:integrase arm-type DNA-binding domain-containing protein [Mesorhizobium sp. ESP6-5]
MRAINKLTAVTVAKTSKPGRYGDGGGLWLQVSQFGTKAWIFRFMMSGKAREMGLGSIETFSLKEARERAREARQLVASGIDPIQKRVSEKLASGAASAKLITFSEAIGRYLKAHGAAWRNLKHADQWKNTLETYAEPTIGKLGVAQIETSHIINILEPIWATKTETASRVRGRIEAILDWATARGFRTGENPARWRGHLDKLLPARGKVTKVQHHVALPYGALPAFLEGVRAAEFISARALEFTILTAARTGEAIGSKWSEFDLAQKIWTIPGERMKSGRDHRVPLSDRVIEILDKLPSESEEYVFPGAKEGRPLSNMAMLEFLRGIDDTAELTVHGFRSTFRDWAAEQTNFPRDIAEAALAHVIADKTEAAYRRGDALEKRRRLMTAWARYCSEKPRDGKVIAIGEAINA